MKTRRFVAVLSVAFALAASNPARADWTNPDPGPTGGSLGMEEMIVAAQWGLQIAQVAL